MGSFPLFEGAEGVGVNGLSPLFDGVLSLFEVAEGEVNGGFPLF